MAVVTTKLRVIDLASDTEIAYTVEVHAFEISHALSKVGTLSYSVSFTGAVAAALIAAGGGPAALLAPKPYYVDLSLDGGANYDAKMLVSAPVQTNVLSENGPTLFHGYTVTGVDRVTFHAIRFADVVYGAAGTIHANGLPGPNSVFNSITLPKQKGFFRTIPGLASWAGQYRLAYYPVVDAHLADILVNSDSEADYLDKCLTTVLTQVTGVVDADDSAPIGSRGQWVEDSSDSSLNLAGVSPSLSIGHLGTTPHLTFSLAADPTDLTQAQILEHAESGQVLAIEADLKGLLAKIAYQGGQSNHGLPEGGSILSPIVVNPPASPASYRWNDNLCLFVSSDSSGFGGVYYWPHDGMAYLLGGSLLAPKALVYYKPANSLYVSTDLGVYTRSADVLDSGDWQRVGGMGFKCQRLVVDALSGQIVTEVKGSGSADGLYAFPGVAGDDSGASGGYSGWSCLSTGGFTAWTFTSAGAELLLADSNSPAVVTQIVSSTSPSSSVSRYLGVPNGSPVTNLLAMSYSYQQLQFDGTEATMTETGTMVATAEGALGLYFLDPAGTFHDLNPDLSLVDVTGMPIAVNAVINYSGDLIVGNRTLRPKLFALTASGLYFTENQFGGGWQSVGEQSGIAAQSLKGLAVGPPQTLVDRTVSRLYATTDKALYCSHTGGIFWDDETSEHLTIGAYLTAIGRLAGQRPFLHNRITSIGKIATGGATGTGGVNLSRTLPMPYTLAGDLVWVRPLDEHNRWTYRLVHTASSAPYTPMEFGEISELVTDSATNHAVASGTLAQAMVRYLGDRSRLQVSLTIRSRFVRATHTLRTLRPTHLVSVDYTAPRPWLADLAGTPFYVIAHKLYKTKADTVVTTETVLSTVCRTAPVTMAEIADGIVYTLGRMHSKIGRAGRK